MDDTQIGGGSPGPSTDRLNNPVVDPTKNVLDLVQSAIDRQDDLRTAEAEHLREILVLRAAQGNAERDHIRELSSLRDQYDDRLRRAEADRIDAIRAVDVDAVRAAALVQATQAATLARQVTDSAEQLRTQVAATAQAAEAKLILALEPIQKRIDDLSRTQSEGVGSRTQVVETRDQGASSGMWIGVAIAMFALFVSVASVATAVVITLTK